MRAIFGLVAILIFVGVLVWFLYAMYLPYVKTVTTVGRKAQDQAAQIAGVDNQAGGRVPIRSTWWRIARRSMAVATI